MLHQKVVFAGMFGRDLIAILHKREWHRVEGIAVVVCVEGDSVTTGEKGVIRRETS